MWAEELIEAARAVEHPRLGQLCVIAAECYRTGRIDDAVRYADAAVAIIDGGGFDRMLYDLNRPLWVAHISRSAYPIGGWSCAESGLPAGKASIPTTGPLL